MTSNLSNRLFVNRMAVAFVLILLLMVSGIPFAASSNYMYLALPLLIVTLLLWWLLFSRAEKTRLINEGKLPPDHSDPIEDLETHNFKKGSKVKLLFASYGMTIGLFIVLISIGIFAFPALLERVFNSSTIYILFIVFMIASYTFLKKRLQ